MKANPERVVITGLGAVSGYGQGIEDLRSGLLEAKTCIRFQSHLDPALPCRIGAAAPFELTLPDCLIVARTLAAKMALIAADQAWSHAGLPFHKEEVKGLQIYSSVGWGPLDFNELYLLHSQGIPLAEHFFARTQSGHGEEVLGSYFRPELGVSAFLSACAASTQAIGRAFYDLRSGRSKIALAGGSDSRLHAPGIIGYDKLNVLARGFENSPEAACRPFDQNRCGFVIGEGAGFVVMETLAHARARGAQVLAEVLGACTNTDSYRLTDPEPKGALAALCLTECLKRAGVEADEVDYIQAHGTGTGANDRAEVVSIKMAFGKSVSGIPISSLKPYFGHASMAAGALELISSVLVLQNQFLPVCLNLDNPESDFSLNFVRNHRPAREVRIILKNSFGFGGQNASLVLRRFPIT